MNGMKTPPRLGTEGHLHRFSLPPPPPVTHSGGRGAETRAAARGGDAFPVPNLKKSWHPQTLRNVEKVWKAEQKHEAERRKIEELQRELQEERAREEMQRYAEDMGTVRKREEKLEWMYQGPGGMVNRDEYLLGRPVDKFILDKVGDKDSAGDTGLLPGSIFARAGASSVLDMATKIREDPLFMIRKREEEKKREVLNNPVKMKKIKALLQNSLDKKERKRKKEKKKKHKKHRRRSSSSSSSSSEEERPRIKSQKRVDNSVWKAAPSKIPGYGLQVRDPEAGLRSRGSPGQDRAPRERSRSPSRSPQRHSSRRNPQRSSASPSRRSKQHSSREEKGRARSPSPKKSFRRQHPPGYTRKISPEELERKRQEMMENAKWREEERANNLRKHRKEEELEKELEKLDSRDGKFFHRLKLESASTSSLEDRVKRNIHSLQRTPAALEKNFMQR
ncbi:pre-mRNA-splicing factor CWC25 homolog isoform X1 [Agelaius tricolor]|uniref:pre-mRNA-splicing factor CWC25 homolog isoform X1 n=2 Tax=Agelaius TaxID=9190 RepID=UPI0023ED3185|nr:pre-mRNA-splicing factor CWC25 homolog isoform X4 [Agelaius phoeniceus]